MNKMKIKRANKDASGLHTYKPKLRDWNLQPANPLIPSPAPFHHNATDRNCKPSTLPLQHYKPLTASPAPYRYNMINRLQAQHLTTTIPPQSYKPLIASPTPCHNNVAYS